MSCRSTWVAAAVLAVSCSSRPEQPAPVPTEPLTKSSEEEPSSETVDAGPPEPAEPQPYMEQVELEGAWGPRDRFRDFSPEYALGDTAAGHQLLDLDTLKLEEFPPFEAEHEGLPHILNTWNREWAVAWFEADEQVEFEVLEFATMRWAVGPPIEVPPRPSADEVKRRSEENRPIPGFTVRPREDGVRVAISDGGDELRYLELDPGTLVWRERTEAAVQGEEPCPFRCRFPEGDLVRWGKDYGGSACAAYRPSPDEAWRTLDVEDASCLRGCRRLPGGDVLVTGGIDQCKIRIFSFAPAKQTARIDVSETKVIDLGETPPLGHRIDLGDDQIIWMRSGFVIRFDPETNTFDEEQGPLIEFEERWQVRLDDRTMLIGGVTEEDGEQVPVAAKFGFR